MTTKLQTVNYAPHKEDFIETGFRARIMCPINHPSPLVTNFQPVFTSTVEKYDTTTGEVTTRNTIYIPIPLKEDHYATRNY